MSLLITKGLGVEEGASGPVLLTTTAYGNRVELTFDIDMVLSGDAALPTGWTINATSPAVAVTVTSVTVVGDTVKLFITEATNGGTYTIVIPTYGVNSDIGGGYQGPYSATFTGVGIPPIIAQASAIDAFRVRVIYSEPVVVSEATNPANYSVSPTLSVFSVTSDSSSNFIVTTSQQTPGTSYTLTASNIHDEKGNLI